MTVDHIGYMWFISLFFIKRCKRDFPLRLLHFVENSGKDISDNCRMHNPALQHKEQVNKRQVVYMKVLC